MTIHTRSTRETAAARIAELVHRQKTDHSLLQDLYNSEEAFQHDMERLFMRHWLLAGHASVVPNAGDWVVREVAGESVIILRGRDGELRAFANVCRHRGSRICLEEKGHSSVLVCPYHSWAYNLDGTLRSARHMPPDFDKATHGLKPVAIEVIEGLIFISFAEKPLAMDHVREAVVSAYQPYGWASAKVAHSETYTIDANWKLAIENYTECYHCSTAHPEYSKVHALEQPLDKIEDMNRAMDARTCALGINIVPIESRVGSETGREFIFNFRYALYDGFLTGSRNGKPLAPLMGAFTDYDGGVTSTHFGPASFFISYPDYGVLYRFLPLTPSTTAMEATWLVRGDAREGIDYDLNELVWLWQVTNEADKFITEDNQRGVNSRYYEPGPYAPVEPNAIRWISWYLGEIT
jgi:phenylpropionate dioxygenase-like ring-hydroxylating dioxygenase large terminal subunit